MTTTTMRVDSVPLLDGKGRSLFAGLVMAVLTLMTIDGVLTWVAAEDARPAIEAIENRDGRIDDRGLILNSSQRAEIASQSDGDRLDRDLVDGKMWLAVIGILAAAVLTISAGPGSSRNVLATMVFVAGGAFFVPLVVYAETIDIVTTSHGG